MGKKIPGKKHRTVRYPEQQKRLRDLKIYHKINNPPKVIDDQEVPKSVRKIQDFKTNLHLIEEKYERKHLEKKQRKLLKKTKANAEKTNRGNLLEKLLVKDGATEETIVISEVRRIKRKTNPELSTHPPSEILKPVVQSSEQPNDLSRVKPSNKSRKSKPHNFSLLKELSDEYPNIGKYDMSEVQRKNRRKKSKKLSKKQKDQLKVRVKQTEVEEESDMYAPVYDKVEFGEIVHAPPKFTKRPRNTQVESKPGKKSNLLLASMLNLNTSGGNEINKTNKRKTVPGGSNKKEDKKNYEPDLKGKRKDLSVADRRRLDKEQAAAIAAYKKLKADKWKAGQT